MDTVIIDTLAHIMSPGITCPLTIDTGNTNDPFSPNTCVRNPLVFPPSNAYNSLRHEVCVRDGSRGHRRKRLLDCRWSPRIDHRYALGA
jgi:hypothetical protein